METKNNQESLQGDQEDIESYIFSLLQKETEDKEDIKEKLVHYWKTNKIQLIESKLNILQKLEKEKHALNNKDEKINEAELSNSKRRHDNMEAYVNYCFKNISNQIDDDKNNNNDNNANRWHPNDIELVQAVVAANRYAFQMMDDNEKEFQQDMKKRKKENEIQDILENPVSSNFQKTIHTKRWNADISINPIAPLPQTKEHTAINKSSSLSYFNSNRYHYKPIEKTFLHS